jgi:Rod binding domain-containing protein
MWEQMRATIPESGLLKGREERFWQSMYDQELAKTMAGAGGIGLADMMYEQLSRTLRSASKDTADAVSGPSGFAEAVAPAPLLRAAPPPHAASAAEGVAAPAHQQKSSALAGLYSEAVAPEAAPVPAAPAATVAQVPTEDETSPAILAVLNELRAAHQAGAADGRQAAGPGGLGLGARPPLPPMQGNENSLIPQGKNLISTLAKPVHKPASGKRTVLPREASGPRVPTGQPVNRNLPYARQESLQAQASGQPQGTGAMPGAPAAAMDKAGAGG